MGPEEIERYVEGDLKREPLLNLTPPKQEWLTSRRIQQTLGTDWGRDLIYPDFWVDVTMTKVRKLMESGKSVVIDDLRFPNEYATITAARAKLIRITRPDADVGDPRYEGQLEGYEFEYGIANVGSIELLKAQAKEIVDAIQLQS